MKLNMTKSELNRFAESNKLEVYTNEQFGQFVENNKDLLVKSDRAELDEAEQREYDTLFAEIRSFTPVTIYDNDPNSKIRIVKSVMYVRPQQVEWDDIEKSEDGEEDLSKARAGVYTDTGLNRKLGRVGQKYGSKKQPTDEGDDKGKSDIKTVSLSSKKGGGFTLNVKMSDGSMKHLSVDNKELASVKNSPIQKDGISKNRTLYELAQSKLSKQSTSDDKSEEKETSKMQGISYDVLDSAPDESVAGKKKDTGKSFKEMPY